MNDSPKLFKDPVCEMMANSGQYEAAHEGICYAFCSLQCRERFVARPGLYVGIRGRPAAKQKGTKLIRQRRVLLGQPLTQPQAAELMGALRTMMGVTRVNYFDQWTHDGHASVPPREGSHTTAEVGLIEIRYDLLEATFAQFERTIAGFGWQLANGPGDKLRRDFVHYLEECELEDIENGDTGREQPRKRRHGIPAAPG